MNLELDHPDGERVLSAGLRLLPDLLQRLHGWSPAPLPDEHPNRESFDVVAGHDRNGVFFTLRLEVVPLPQNEVGRTFVNSISENHVVQLSDRLGPAGVGTVLSYELGELHQVRADTAAGLSPAPTSALSPGPRSFFAERLAVEDAARLGELNWLAHLSSLPDTPPELERACRAAFSNRLDTLGLRSDLASSTGPIGLEWRKWLAIPHMTEEALVLYQALGHPESELARDDALSLRAFRTHPQNQVQEPQGTATREQGSWPQRLLSPGENARFSPEELRDMAEEAATRRNEHSTRTLDVLRRRAAALPEGRYPQISLMVGGGAALAGRRQDQLVVDARGRWHVDPIRALVQSAEQVRHLPLSGMGDPGAFVGPKERVPLDAVRLWEDRAAVEGPLINGNVDFSVDANHRLLATLSPLDGSRPLTVEVEGTPVIATGIPPEIIPGASPVVPTTPEAVSVLADQLGDLEQPGAREAAEGIRSLPDRPGSAQLAMETAGAFSIPSETDTRLAAAMQTLNATVAWDNARAAAPGRVLYGDDVGDGRYDPGITDKWLIAGIGGAAIANAEIILEANQNAQVTMVGSAAPWVLENDAQYLALRRKHDSDYNGDGRLSTHSGHRLGPVETVTGSDGTTRFHAAGQQGEAYIACLGRVARPPRVLDPIKNWARTNQGEISGHISIDERKQYLGYELDFSAKGHTFSAFITGAASRMPPADIFSRDEIDRVAQMGDKETPRESGNVAAGFMATALQASRLPRGSETTNNPQVRTAKTDNHLTQTRLQHDNTLSAPEGLTPSDRQGAVEWMSAYWKDAEDLVKRGELGPETAPTMLELHTQADRVAAVAYEGQDQQLAKHAWYQKVQKAVFMAGQRGVDNADLPSSPHEYFSATQEERTRYVEAMKATKTVRRSQQRLAPPSVQSTNTPSPDGDRRNRGSQEGPDLER